MAEAPEPVSEASNVPAPTAEEQTDMFRVYVGNLDPQVEEGTLRGLFEEQGVVVGNILIKRNYAFVDCPDQANCDRAIDRLNGYNLLGSVMQVEPSMSRRRRSNKIQIRNFPPHISREEVVSLLGNSGPPEKCEQVGAEGLIYITFENADQAQQAITQVNGLEYQGMQLKAEFANNRPMNRRPRMNNNNTSEMNRQEMPLRILVGSEFVGAVIGRQGQTIHNITSQSKARVDIHRRENISQETLVTIKGSPESCTEACKEIMKVVQKEAQALNKGEYPFKILCPNSLCGRIIGKQGNVIKNFMEQTDTHIVVSSATDVNNFFIDRVITVSGPADNAAKAEALLSEKMRKCMEQDSQNYNQQMGMFSSIPPPMGMMGPPGMGNYPNMRPFPPYGMEGQGFYPPVYGAPQAQPPQQELEVTYLYIPENTVGAVIGSKGANIKQVMKDSSARIKILPPKTNEMNGERKGPSPQLEERKVIITGTAEAQWKAQFYIFDKIKTEGGFQRIEEVHLRSEVMVPKSMIGRIIGKGGQNVREMQRVSGAIVKLPDINSSQVTDESIEEVPVSIIGHFYAMQPAQRRIRALVSQRRPQGPGMPQRRRPPGPPREQNGKP